MPSPPLYGQFGLLDAGGPYRLRILHPSPLSSDKNLAIECAIGLECGEYVDQEPRVGMSHPWSTRLA